MVFAEYSTVRRSFVVKRRKSSRNTRGSKVRSDAQPLRQSGRKEGRPAGGRRRGEGGEEAKRGRRRGPEARRGECEARFIEVAASARVRSRWLRGASEVGTSPLGGG